MKEVLSKKLIIDIALNCAIPSVNESKATADAPAFQPISFIAFHYKQAFLTKDCTLWAIIWHNFIAEPH